jgi:integrase
LNHNELTDLLAVAEDEDGDPYALVCPLALNGLRVSEACQADIADLGGWRYQPTLQGSARATSPRSSYSTPRTYQTIDQAVNGRCCWTRQAADAAAQRRSDQGIIRRLATATGITHRVIPHALRRSSITVGLLQGVPLREMQRAARHAKADTTVGYDQSERSFYKDPTFVLMAATAR